jgi:hypothetical protein
MHVFAFRSVCEVSASPPGFGHARSERHECVHVCACARERMRARVCVHLHCVRAAMPSLPPKSSTALCSPAQAHLADRKRRLPILREPKHPYAHGPKVYADSFAKPSAGFRRDGSAQRPLPKVRTPETAAGSLPWLLVIDDPEPTRGQWTPLPSVTAKWTPSLPPPSVRLELPSVAASCTRAWNGALPPL